MADPGGTATHWEQDAAATVVPCCPGSLSRVLGVEAQAGVQSWHGAQVCRHLCRESRKKDSCQEGFVSVGAPQGHGPALLQKVRLAHSQPRERSDGRCPLPFPGLNFLNSKIGIVILFSPTSLGCSVAQLENMRKAMNGVGQVLLHLDRTSVLLGTHPTLTLTPRKGWRDTSRYAGQAGAGQ